MLLPFFALISSTLAATKFDCFSFEQSFSEEVSFHVVNTEVQTSLLIYKLSAIIDTNIPFQGLSDELLEARYDDFGICTKEFQSHYPCDTVDEFVIKFKNQLGKRETNIYNSVLTPQNLKIVYPTKAGGVYCLVAHQKGQTIKGFWAVPHHSYGQLFYEKYVEYKIFLVALVLETTLLFIFKRIGIVNESVPHSVIKNFLSFSVFTHLINSLRFYFMNLPNHGHNFYRIVSMFFPILYVIESFFAQFVLFGASLNKSFFCNIKEDIEVLKSNRRFLLLISGQFLIKSICLYKIYLNSSADFSFKVVFLDGFSCATFFIIIKNYRRTKDELKYKNDKMKEYVKKYRLSVYVFFIVTTILAYSETLYSRGAFIFLNWWYQRFNPTMNPSDIAKITEVTIKEYKSTYPIILLSCISKFSLSVISLALIFVWKPLKRC